VIVAVRIVLPNGYFPFNPWYLHEAFHGCIFYTELVVKDKTPYFRLAKSDTNREVMDSRRDHLSKRAQIHLDTNTYHMLYLNMACCEIVAGGNNQLFKQFLKKEEELWTGS
jgi:hypothetical protein